MIDPLIQHIQLWNSTQRMRQKFQFHKTTFNTIDVTFKNENYKFQIIHFTFVTKFIVEEHFLVLQLHAIFMNACRKVLQECRTRGYDTIKYAYIMEIYLQKQKKKNE